MGWFLHGKLGLSTQQLLADAQQALQISDNSEAERLSTVALQRAGPSPSTTILLVAGEAAAKCSHYEDAVRHYARVLDAGDQASLAALSGKADALFQLGRFLESEGAFRKALEIDPHNELSNRRFAALLDTTGRRWESRRYLLELVRIGKFTVEELVLLGNPDEPFDNTPVVEKGLEAVPDDPGPLLAKARVLAHRNETPQAVKLLWKVVRARSDNHDAQGFLGALLVDLRSEREFDEWRKQLPKDADRHPEVWFARGVWAEQAGQLEAAIRCYWEAIRIDPDHRRANYRIGLALKGLSRTDLSEPFVRRAQLLSEFAQLARPVYTSGAGGDTVPKVPGKAEELGRVWEAWAWSIVLAKEKKAGAIPLRDRLRKILDERSPPQTLNEFNPARDVDLSHYPLPDWLRARAAEPPALASRQLANVQARFVDSTREAGIDFTFFSGDDPDSKGMKIHQTMGGGIAVLDYDGDGWPDMHFTQGSQEPYDDRDLSHVDRLYRNLGNGRFTDVTLAAGVADHWYSQGATVGDYDNDGFPDLFILNIGKSRLFHNNGDGTFADVTDWAGIQLNHWSTSGLIADLNGDGLPDLLELTYIREREVLYKMCGAQFARTCTPLGIEGDVDHLLLNLGDGTFRDVTAEAGLGGLKGKGLGIVAADFDRSGRLSLFITNDTEVNYYLANLTGERGAPPLFEERGMLNGLAVDREGQTRANMGIAADDCNGDGLLDLFVTTFADEPKTLRIQQSEQMFLDMTREANLRDSGFKMLGFGTQFLDGELDGLPDLVVANGHVDDFSHEGRPFEMRPQYFRNIGKGRFIERPAETLGPYFEARHLGRCLVRLDWNRDGREDFAVSHVNEPSALITNQTAGAGHFIALRLVAVKSARDAIGAIVSLMAGDFTRVRELTAGDGYYASNQRELVFGLGNHEKVDRILIQWPSGGQQEFSNLDVDREYLAIENRDTIVPLMIER